MSDLKRSRAFYRDLLGLQVLLEDGGYLRIGGGDGFHVGMESGPEVGAAGIEINLRVDDVDRYCQELRARGVHLETPPTDMPWGARHAWLRDPDGYRLSVFTPTERR